MKHLLLVMVVFVLCVVGLGFYRGWFTLSRPNGAGDGNKINVQLSVDPDKVKADATEAKDKVTERSGTRKEDAK